MSLPPDDQAPTSPGPEDDHVVVIGPDGRPVAVPASGVRQDDDGDDGGGERNLTGLVEQPAKVMRIGRMVQQLL